MKNNIILIIVILSFICFGSSVTIDPFIYSVIPPVDYPIRHSVIDEQPTRCFLPPMRTIPARYETIIYEASAKAGIPVEIIVAIIWVESSFRSNAISPIRADGHKDLGICQFNSEFLEWYSEKYNDGVFFDPMDPVVAINIAALHIRWLYERYGHWPDVAMAYNAGFPRIDRNEIPESTWDYLFKIYREQ
jgi:hypothetical protein